MKAPNSASILRAVLATAGGLSLCWGVSAAKRTESGVRLPLRFVSADRVARMLGGEVRVEGKTLTVRKIHAPRTRRELGRGPVRRSRPVASASEPGIGLIPEGIDRLVGLLPENVLLIEGADGAIRDLRHLVSLIDVPAPTLHLTLVVDDLTVATECGPNQTTRLVASRDDSSLDATVGIGPVVADTVNVWISGSITHGGYTQELGLLAIVPLGKRTVIAQFEGGEESLEVRLLAEYSREAASPMPERPRGRP